MYCDGDLGSKDPVQGIYWLKILAERGDIFGQYNLAIAYQNGEGVAQDYEQAIHWCTLAASQGDEEAIGLLNSLLRKDEAKKSFEKEALKKPKL